MKRRDAIGVLDLGASGGRFFAATIHDRKLLLEEIHRFAHSPIELWEYGTEGRQPQFHPCWDLYAIWRNLLEGLRKIATRDDLRLISFALDTWGSDGAWMTADGDMLHPIATGRDPRWSRAREEIQQQISPEALFQTTGLQSHPFNVLNQIHWYVHHQPKLVEAAATYLPINGLLNYFLTGQRVAEYTWISTTQLCPATQMQYDRHLFTQLQLPLEKMPPLVAPGTSLGRCCSEIAARCGLEPFEVIATATHDTACAYTAAPIDSYKPAFIVSTGTWFLAGVITKTPIITHDAFVAGFANEGGVEGVRFLKNILGMWPLQELRRQWTYQDGSEMLWDTMNDLALAATPCAYKLDLTDARLFAPVNMEQVVMAVCRDFGPAPANRAQMVRGLYEALALSVAQTAKLAEKLSGIHLREIIILGGCARNRVLCQWIADASGLLVRAAHPDATACGNAMVQAKTLGWINSLVEGRRMLEQATACKVFEPHPNNKNIL